MPYERNYHLEKKILWIIPLKSTHLYFLKKFVSEWEKLITTKFWRMSKRGFVRKAERAEKTSFIISLHFRTIINLFRLSKMSFYFIYVFSFFFFSPFWSWLFLKKCEEKYSFMNKFLKKEKKIDKFYIIE